MRLLIQRISIMFCHHLLEVLRVAFFAFSSIFLIFEAQTYFFNFQIKDDKRLVLFLLTILACTIFGMIRAIPASKIKFRLKHCDTFVEIRYGDIFSPNGCIIIPVNEYFDIEIGDCVSPLSLHGQFISKYFKGRETELRLLIDTHLLKIPHSEVVRQKGNTKKYPIGTCIDLEIAGQKFVLVALTRTDTNSLKANADVADWWKVLSELWQHIRICAGGVVVNVPLIGGGLSGVGLPPMHLLQLLIISLSKASSHQKIANNISITIGNHLLGDVNLKTIKGEWR